MWVEVKLPLTCALVTTVMVCLGLPSLLAQRYSFKRYDQDSGLPDQSIRTLLQDRSGFLWIATDNGLHRYDGHGFRSYTKEDGLPGAQVEALYQTPDGAIWAATIPGLGRLKGERFEPVDIGGKRGAGALASDSSGRLYVGTWSGLVALSTPTSPKPAWRVYQLPSGEARPVRSVAVAPTRRRAHRNEYCVSRSDCLGELGRKREAAIAQVGRDDVTKSGLIDRDDAARERVDLVAVLVDTGDMMAKIGKTSSRYQPNIARPDHCNLHAIPYVFDSS